MPINSKHSRLRPYQVRQIVQGVFLALFLYLFVQTAFPLRSGLPVDLFFRFDPLVAVSAWLAGKVFLSSLLLAVVVLMLTLLFGRFFCAYVCPMGTTITICDHLLARKNRVGKYLNKIKNLKYYLLFLVIFTALFGVLLVYLLDPISILTRSFTFILYPLARFVANFSLDIFRPVAQKLDLISLSHLRYDQPTFFMSWVTLGIFIAILGLSYFQSRFWCRNLCPLGAMLSLLSRLSLLKGTVRETCNECGQCLRICNMNGIVGKPSETLSAECNLCLNCLEVCKPAAISFQLKVIGRPKPTLAFNPSRRGFLTSLGAGIVSAAALGWYPARRPPRGPIRPPGSIPEESFLDRCIRCGECFKVCPTNTLQPVFREAGWEGLWTPALVPRKAPCDPKCNACGKVCPTQAIRDLSLAEKNAAHIGTATVNKKTCWPWAEHKACQICFDECKAAKFNAIELHVINGWKKPVVFPEKCVGCGLCEFRCPVNANLETGYKGRAAIVVSSQGEQRILKGSYIALNQNRALPQRQPPPHPVIKPTEEDKKQYLPPFLQ